MLLKNGAVTNYGQGVQIKMMDNHRIISHGGEVSGFTAYYAVFPDDTTEVVVLTNHDASAAANDIGNNIFSLLFKSLDTKTKMRTEQARKIFIGLQHGTIDRSLFTPDADAYFSEQALKDFQSGLDTLNVPDEFIQTAQSERGGMLLRLFRVEFQDRTLRVWTYQMPDGKLE